MKVQQVSGVPDAGFRSFYEKKRLNEKRFVPVQVDSKGFTVDRDKKKITINAESIAKDIAELEGIDVKSIKIQGKNIIVNP